MFKANIGSNIQEGGLNRWPEPAVKLSLVTATQNSSDLVTIGLDLGDRAHHYCVLDFAGTIQTEAAIPNTRECLAQLSERFPRARFIRETGTHSAGISRWLEAQGHRVIVANARKLRAISASHTKTDTEDARLLARLGRADPALPSPAITDT